MFTKVNSVPKDGEKSALLIRLGAWGDMVWASAVVKKLKEEGYHITLNCTDRGYLVVKHDPNISRFVVLEDGELTYDALVQKFWPILEKGFDKVVNLSGSVENALAVTPGTIDPLTQTDMYNWPKEQLDARCNVNFMDQTMRVAGYPDAKGMQGQLFFTKHEEEWAQKFRANIPGFFLLWALGGSAAHKAYPYAHIVAEELLKRHPDMQIVTVGDELCKLLEFQHPQVINKAGAFGIRKSLVLTKYADAVFGPDSSVVNAASCYDVPKVVLLSSASHENLTKYWTNTTPLWSNVPCFPCHKIHYQLDCPLVEEIKAPVCMGKLSPDDVFMAIEKVYWEWKAKQPVGV